MIERKAYAALMRLAEQFPVVAITGQDRAGNLHLQNMHFQIKNIFLLMIRI